MSKLAIEMRKRYLPINEKEEPMKQRPRSIKSKESTRLNHCALLVFITAQSRLALSSSLGCHVILAWVEDQAWVTNVEEDRSKSDHAMRLSVAYHCQRC